MGSPLAPEVPPILAALASALGRHRIPFMLIGGQAVLLHGRPRLTEDIDITLGVAPDRLPDLLEVCATAALTPLPADPAGFVRDTFVLPARHNTSGMRADFIFSTTPYERAAIARAVLVRLAGTDVPFATAEDLILHKLFAARPRDLEDVESVVRRKGETLDWEYLQKWAAEFSAIPGREGMPLAVRQLRDEAR